MVCLRVAPLHRGECDTSAILLQGVSGEETTSILESSFGNDNRICDAFSPCSTGGL